MFKSFIIITFFIFTFLSLQVEAQTSCGVINTVATNVTEVESEKIFNCNVTVDSSFAGSKDIACGISFNGEWPLDFCPSDEFFGGWQGNEARFNCVFPNTNIPDNIDKVELVAFDFRPNCGPETGKAIPLTLKQDPNDDLEKPASPQDQLDYVRDAMRILFGTEDDNSTEAPTPTTPPNNPQPTIDTPSPSIPTQPPDNPPPTTNPTFTTLRSVLDYIGAKVGVPPKVLEAVAFLEYTPTFTLPPAVIQSSTKPGNVMPNCPINECSAAGPMQMTIGRDNRGSPSCSRCCWLGNCISQCPNAWSEHGSAASIYENTPAYTPLACNIRDNIYAGAKKLKTDAKAVSTTSWTRDEVYRAGRRYFGDCTVGIREGKTYCEFMWWYYNK